MPRALLLVALLVGATLFAPAAAALPPTWTPVIVPLIVSTIAFANCQAQELQEEAGVGTGCPGSE